MKTAPPRVATGMTAIELIVVLSIISVLVALLIPVQQSCTICTVAGDAATVVRNVVNAASSYKQDYGSYPKATKAENKEAKFYAYGDKSVSPAFTTDNRELLDVLRAIPREGGENAGNVLNPKRVTYYENRKATGPKFPRTGFADGPEFSPEYRGNLYDPWGTQYAFILETDKDGTVDLSPIYTDLSGPNNVIPFGAVGISAGKSRKLGGRDNQNMLRKPSSNEAEDDIVSWK